MSAKLCRVALPLHRLLAPHAHAHAHRVCSQVCLGTEAAAPPPAPAPAPAADKVIIPPRVQRAPTDVLKALAGTVKRDTSGPHYKYIDDPFLIPSSNLTKRSYALSKESGRKAARWVRDKHPKLFTHRPEEPFVESFFPKTRYHKDSEVTTDTLRQLVERGEVSDAITVYHLCKKKDVELHEDVLQSLLELMCFYNCEEPLEGAWVEERWYRQASPTVKKTWKDQGLAEDVFAAMPNKGSAAFCAMIRGMSQYYQVDRAWQLYQECQEKAIPLDTGTYNSLIRVASMLRDNADLRWQLVKELLTAMAESGTKPDLGTLNATLEALTQMSAWRQAREWSLQVLAEFHQQGIQPSLATYYYLLTIHYRERGPVTHILLDILDQIQGCSFTIQHPMDIHFFVTAMNVARNQLQSMEAARRIDELLHVGDNHLFIGDSFKESVYYRHYFGLCCSTLPFDEFMEVYSELVPHVYTPEPGIMQEVLQAVKVSGHLHHLPQLWSDMILFDLALREKLVDLMLSALATHYPDLSTEEEGLTARLAEVVKDIWARVQGQAPDRRNRLTWLGSMLGQELEVLVRFGEYSTAKEVLKEATTAPDTILGYLPYQPLASLLAAAIEKGDTETAVGVVLYSRDAGHLETGQMALKVTSSLSLTPRQRAQITSDLGFDTSAATP